MKYVRSLIKKIFNIKIIIYLRNKFDFRPTRFTSYEKVNSGSSISDAFCWRTDQGYSTTFKFTDLPKFFFKMEDSQVEILIYSKDHNLLKKLIINNLNHTNEILIDKNLLEGIESYGSFYIFHKYQLGIGEDYSIYNRCYTGYSKDRKLNSFVHGNLPALYREGEDDHYSTDIVKNTIFKNQKYIIQNKFDEYDRTELFFNNPTSQKLYISVNQNSFSLNSHCSKLLSIDKADKVIIKSNCYFVRPVVFNYKGEYYDVYHS